MGRGERGRLAASEDDGPRYGISIIPAAKADYNGMQAADKPRILRAVKDLKRDAFPQQSHFLKGAYRTYRALKVGQKIRVVYKVEGSRVIIYAVGSHENFYDRFKSRLGVAHEAMPTSWRPIVAQPYWLQHDVTISSEGGASGRKQFEIHVNGKPFANRPTLAGAKAAVEERYGPLEWRTLREPQMETTHFYFGPTIEFTSPTTIWVADLTA